MAVRHILLFSILLPSIFCRFAVAENALLYEYSFGPHGDTQGRAQSPLPFTVEELLEEMANHTAEQIEIRLRQIVDFYRADGFRMVAAALDKLIEKNLSAKEVAILTGVLEMATDEQVTGNWMELASRIARKLKKKGSEAPEVRAVKILADQTINLALMSPQAKINFRKAQKGFKDSLFLMGDKNIDGKGVAMLFTASFSLSSFALLEGLRDLKAAFNPVEMERTLKAAALLGNSIANGDPSSKAVLRSFLSSELEHKRITTNEDGSVNWSLSLSKIASTGPKDAREIARVLAGANLISPQQAQAVSSAIGHTEAARSTLQKFASYLEQPGPKDLLGLQTWAQKIQGDISTMNESGQIGDSLARQVQAATAMVIAGGSLAESSRMIQEGLKNPITQRRLNTWFVAKRQEFSVR